MRWTILTALLLQMLQGVVSVTTPKFTLVQNAHNTSCTTGTTTCVITVAATGAGNVLVFGASQVGGTNANWLITSAATGAGTMSLCTSSACHATSGSQTRDMGFVASSTSGVTSLTVTLSLAAGNSWQAFVKEYSFTAGPVSFDVGGTVVNASCTTSCTGVALTPTGTNDLIVHLCAGVPNCTAVNSPYSGDAVFFNGDGYAASPNTTSGTAPTWTLNTSGGVVLSAIALKTP